MHQYSSIFEKTQMKWVVDMTTFFVGTKNAGYE